MAIEQLSADEQAVVRAALEAVLTGPYLADWEFATRVGVDRAEVAALVLRWPAVDDTAADSSSALAITNVLNEVCNGPDMTDAEWGRWSSVPREAVREVYHHWTTLR